jgi:hypothetical protein
MIEDNFRHIRKIIEQQDQIRKMVEPYNRIQKMLEPTRRLIDSTRQFAQMNESIMRMRAIESRIPMINPAIREHAERMNRIRESIDLFNKNLPGYLIAIASYGWYLDLQTDMDLSVKLARDIDNGEIKKVDSFLIKYYQINFDSIVRKLQKNHPKRKRIFEEIKIGFDNSYYNLVIPLILSQIDGICHDWTNKLFFIKNKKNEKNPYLPKVSNELIAFNGQFIEAFLAPFFHDAPIFAHEDNLNSFPIGFNRHKVLHGLDTEFGTMINCLKALSLISYCEDILLRLINDFNEDE